MNEVLEPNLPIVDAHHHLFDRAARRYMFEDYLADVNSGHNIIASVYVETQAMERADGPLVLRPLGEVEFANGVAAMSASGIYGPSRLCSGIVGYADMTAGAAVAELLDRSIAASPERFRGVRQVTIEHPTETPFKYMTNRPPAGRLSHPGFRSAFRLLAPRNLVFDAAVTHLQLPRIAALADEFDDTTIVVEHSGLAYSMREDGETPADSFDLWRSNLKDIAARPNVMCKIGGLGMPSWGFGFDEAPTKATYVELSDVWGPYIHTAIEFFGAERCMLQSNYPMDSRTADFVTIWNAFKHTVSDYSVAEKSSLFSATAQRVYRLA